MLRLAFVLLVGLGIADPPPAGGPAPPPPPKKAQEHTVDELHGTWIYAKDPLNRVGTEPIYEGSTMTFTADGKYSFQLAATSFPLDGSYEVRSWGKDGGVLHTNYGQGRENLLHIELHRNADGIVQGYIVREGEDKVGGRYYRRADN